MSAAPNSSGLPQLEPGAVFANQYKLIERAGKGGFGEVWKAWDNAGCRVVALKFIGLDIQDDFFRLVQEGVGVFKNFQDTQSLNHQHICPIYGLKPSNYGPFLIMKWLEGESLRNRHNGYLRQGKLIPRDEVYKILLDIAEALDYAHSRGIVHRDVKPDNIFIERFKNTEDAILLDFGLADVIQETRLRSSLSSSQSRMGDNFGGTPPYMAPEQWRASRHLNGRTDQYALGVVAYELLSGERPFNTPSLAILREAVLNETPEKIDDISSEANAALQTALSKKKEERFFSCREFVQSLELNTAAVKTKSSYNPVDGVHQVDVKESECFRKAAKQGDARAQYGLGLCYARGKGVPQDMKKAVKWFRKAAEQGNAVAQGILGNCYYRGDGVSEDKKEAFKWYRKAAEQGNAVAQFNLGNCYYRGDGVLVNSDEAVYWFHKAAKLGNTRAQYHLGYCYENGIGISMDKKEAVNWYRKAAEQGYEDAIEALKNLSWDDELFLKI